MRMSRSDWFSYSASLCSASKRSLSQASDALETSSLRKISRLEYSEWIIRCSSCLTSVWKPSVSRLAVVLAVIWISLEIAWRLVWDGGEIFQEGCDTAARSMQCLQSTIQIRRKALNEPHTGEGR